MPDQPPRFAERLLLKIVGGRDSEIIAGDLREAFETRGGGRLWYWLQVLSCLLVRLSPHRRVIPDLRRDLHYALRVIRRNPGYATTAGRQALVRYKAMLDQMWRGVRLEGGDHA